MFEINMFSLMKNLFFYNSLHFTSDQENFITNQQVHRGGYLRAADKFQEQQFLKDIARRLPRQYWILTLSLSCLKMDDIHNTKHRQVQ